MGAPALKRYGARNPTPRSNILSGKAIIRTAVQQRSCEEAQDEDQQNSFRSLPSRTTF